MAQFDAENKDVLLATAIASGTSASAAARDLDIPLRTVQRRTADPDFRRMVADIRREVLTAALGRITDNLTRAADTVAALLDAEQPHIRLRAARALVTLGLKLQDSVELAGRVQELEQELARKQGVTP